MTPLQIRTALLKAGVHNLHEFGYPHCTVDNILRDMIYSRFFRSMLEENRGKSPQVDVEIEGLLRDIDP